MPGHFEILSRHYTIAVFRAKISHAAEKLAISVCSIMNKIMTNAEKGAQSQVAQERLRRLERVLEMSRALSAVLDPKELLQSIAQSAAELTGSEQGAIAQYDASADCLRFITAPWMDAEQMKELRVPVEGSIVGQAFREHKPVITEDVQQHETHFKAIDQATQFQTRSMLAVPLTLQGKATGVLSAVNKRRAGFDAQDVEVMESLAAQAAIAIQNAQLLQESREAYAALAELEEMRSNFIAITSHELRIPLGLILGHASFLKEIVDGEPRQQAEVIEKAALRLKQIVEDLSKIEVIDKGNSTLRRQRYDLVAQMRQLLNAHAASAQQREIELTSKLPNEPVFIEADSEKIYVAVEHVLRNGIGFTNKGGRVELGLQADDAWATIQVVDNGIGIPIQDQQRIFERFFQAEDHMTRKHGGMGLGLTVAKLMMEMHGGTIAVESSPGAGSSFRLRLPKAS
jgi:signal transduction histidine kinase